MKRSGRKSAAQTPAPPSERIRGSKTNPKGSAASTESANKIKLSEDILKTLKNKADAYNEKHPKSKVSVATLKAVFRRGAGAYSSSHRPTISGGRPNSRSAWAFARVNKFLLKRGGTKVKAAYVQDDDLMERGGVIRRELKGNIKKLGGYYIVKGQYKNQKKHLQELSKILSEKGLEKYEYTASPTTNSYYAVYADSKHEISIRLSDHTKPSIFDDGEYKFIDASSDEDGYLMAEIYICSNKDFEDAKKWIEENLQDDDLMAKGGVIENQYYVSIKYNQDSKGRIIGKYKNLGRAIARIKLIKEDNNLSYESLEIHPNYKTKNIFGVEGIYPIYIYDLGQKDSEVIFPNNLEEEKLLTENFLLAKRYVNNQNGKKVKAAYVQDDDLMAKGGETFSDTEGLYLIIKDVKQENRYKGAYKKIFDIIEDSVSFYNPYGTEYEEIKGSDLHIYITPRPDGHIIEEIKRLKNVEISDSGLSKYHLGGDMSKHLAPNGKPSNLTHEQWHLVRTPEFKAWFGDWENDPENASKVIDENGEPLVVYHGSKKNFTEFRKDKLIWVTPDKDYISKMSGLVGENTYELFANARKVIDLSSYGYKYYDQQTAYKVLKNYGIEIQDILIRKMGALFYVYIQEFQDEIKSQLKILGYDGIKLKVHRNFDYAYAFFDSNQIKLADGTNTTFDANNPDIRYEEGGEMQQNIALPDTYSTFDKLKPILANQGYELNKIGDNNFAEGGLLKPTMSVAQIAKKHGKKESYIEKQLEIGTKHELEHSYSEELAKKTALHHLAEMADYYTRLKKMELQQEAEKLTNYYADGGVTDYGTCEVLDEDGERMIDEKSIKQLTECVMNLPQTKSFHIDFETSQYKPYRKRLHKDIIYQIKKDLVCVEREEPIAILLGGSPASGKSTFLKKYAPYLLSDEILKIDADEIRAKLPEYRGYNAAQTHLETKDIVTTLLSDRNIGIPCTFDVIYDGTMNNTKSYAPLIQLLKSLGYKVFIIYIDKVPKNVAIERALKRYQNSGRFVPVEVIEDFFTKGKTALNELKGSVDGYMIVDGSDKNYHVIERGGMKIPQDRTYSNIGSPIKITTEEVVREFAKGGQVGMQGNIKHSSGAAGGYLVGKRHSEGGIKAINKSTNQPLEMEGGEVVITRDAVSDSEKREFEGEMLTNREILSRINQSGGGVSFEKGGQTDYKCACNGKKYAYGGKVLSDYEIVNQINRLYPNSIMTYSEYKNQINQEGTTKQYFDHLENMGVDISSITFVERAKLLTY